MRASDHFCPSAQARWVLKYHGVPFTCWEYTPIVGETWMKFKAGKAFSKERVTAPVLLKSDGGSLSALDIPVSFVAQC